MRTCTQTVLHTVDAQYMAIIIIVNQKIFCYNISDLIMGTWFCHVSPRTGLDTEGDWVKGSPSIPCAVKGHM